jgi:hypothetical protein
MPTKTERILSYLPSTFKVSGTRSALKTVVDTFGRELLHGENSLAALMRAHWVDHADSGADKIDDLARIAALYGLAPRPQQTVEEFRTHLKQYIKTALEGTVTVQGILRTTANNLGLTIADSYDDIDTWWTRQSDSLVTKPHCGNDAAYGLFGEESLVAHGHAATAARIVGLVNLDNPLDLSSSGTFASRTLNIKVNAKAKVSVDLLATAANPSAVTSAEIVDAINQAFNAPLAAIQNHKLVLTALTSGATSSIWLEEHVNDAAPIVLGFAAHSAKGQAATAASYTGSVDLSGNRDLSQTRFLRVKLNTDKIAEIDCAGPMPEATSIEQISDAINSALGSSIASHDDKFLTLKSSLIGTGSSITFLSAAAQDAKNALLGSPPSAVMGHDKLAATLIGTNDLSKGVDLTQSYILRIRVNNSNAVNVDCRGLDPASSQLPEIISIINDTLGKKVASHNGRHLILSSTTSGIASKLTIEDPAPNNGGPNNAAQVLLGIVSRSEKGSDATAAKITSLTDLSGGINLYASHQLRISLDQSQPVDINLKRTIKDLKSVSINDITDSINTVLGANIASHNGSFLTLLSPKKGSNSQIIISPFTNTHTTKFVSQAPIKGEASEHIFGFNSALVQGQEAIPARVIGTTNLSRGVDLRTAQYLTLKMNDNLAVTINCAGPRPRATLLSEVIENINNQLGSAIARQEDGKLMLIAATTDSGAIEASRIEFIPPEVTDASSLILDVETGLIRGLDALSVNFVGTTDLASEVDLSSKSHLKLTIDDTGPLDISCVGPIPASTTLAQITIAINVAFGKNVANHDGKHLILSSQKTGADSRIEILPADATDIILGISSPRLYTGREASPATITGRVDFTGILLDLSEQHFLEIALDGNAPLTIDCSKNAIDVTQVSLAEIVDEINSSAGQGIASEKSGVLVLTSPTQGLSSRINLIAHTGSDGKNLLFGDIASVFEGSSATSAVLESNIPLTAGVDLSERNLIKLRIDQQPMTTIDIKGGKQDQVFVEEVIAAINAQVPGLAQLKANNQLRLISPSTGNNSSIELFAIRFLKLQEYLPTKSPKNNEFDAEHGSQFRLTNSGAAKVPTTIVIKAKQGVLGAGLVNCQLNWTIRLFSLVHPGEKITFNSHSQHGVEALITGKNGQTRKITGSQLEVGPLLPHMTVPAQNIWRLSKGLEKTPAITLNNPLSPNILIVKSQLTTTTSSFIDIQVKATDLDSAGVISKYQISDTQSQFMGKLHYQSDQYQLFDKDQQLLTTLLINTEIDINAYLNKVVIVTGTLQSALGMLVPELITSTIASLFSVQISSHASGLPDIEERYPVVTIGEKDTSEYCLEQQLIFSDPPSSLARAVSREKQQILMLPKGQSNWRYVECHNSRFDQTHFDSPSKYAGRFAGDFNLELGLMGISHAHNQPPAQVSALYSQPQPKQIHKTKVTFDYTVHQAGTMRVILPVDLPARFGGRFNQALFSVPENKPETHSNVVTEPETDNQYLVTIVNANSNLITAKLVNQVPLGFSAQSIPFSKAIAFIGGSSSEPAKMFLSEPEVSGFVELSAKAPGIWGNQVSVVVCETQPAIFDLLVNFAGSRFENARNAVLGDEITGVVNESLRPGAMGVRQAKAAGVKVEVVRENCETTVNRGGQ